MMNRWNELLEIASSINLGYEDDAIIWQYNSLGVYSVQSLYAIVNNRGEAGLHRGDVKNKSAT
jgi:hypothetical protein